MKIRQRLTLLVCVVALPMLLLLVAVVWQLDRREQRAGLEAATYSLNTMRSAVDSEIGKYILAVRALAMSPALETGDLSAFRQEADRNLIGLPGAWCVLSDAQGQQLINTAAMAGQVLPRLSPEARASETLGFETKQLQVSGVTGGPVVGGPAFGVSVPIFQNGAPAYFVSIAARLEIFKALLSRHERPDGWEVAIVDRTGRFVFRSLDHERWAGKSVPEGTRAILQKAGWHDIRSVEDVRYIATSVVSPVSGWVVGGAIRTDVFEHQVREAVVAALLPGLLLTLAGLALAVWAASRISSPIAALEAGAQALRRGNPVAFVPTRVDEVDRVLAVFQTTSQALLAEKQKAYAARAEAEQAKQRAEEAVETQSRFFAAASHDLRQPLQAMRLFFDVLDQGASGPQRVVVDRLGQAMRSAEDLLHDLLEVSYIDSGSIAVRPVKIDLAALVGDLATELEPVAHGKGLAIRRFLPAVSVLADPAILRRILFNLIGNAIKYTGQGGVLVGLRRRPGRLMVEVWDSGIGISDDHGRMIFDDFYQVANSARDRSQGIGLGLGIVARLCRLMGYEVAFSSRVGKGSVFRVSIPLDESGAVQVGPRRAQASQA